MFRNALVSVSNKKGLVEFLRPLVENGMRVVSTGGTLRHLREHGLPAVDISEQTGFPEVMDGRVKTLHPKVHMAILARLNHSSDEELLKSEGIEPFDLVVVNLYPFSEALSRGVSGAELIEYIDIGGPTLLRAAAKCHERVTVVCDPQDYPKVALKNSLTLIDRQALAAKVFQQVALYDQKIANTLLQRNENFGTREPKNSFLNQEASDPNHFFSGQMVAELRYGENPQQKANWFSRSSTGLHCANILHGKPLSFNNLLDLDAAVRMVAEISQPCSVAVKHNNPCGVGMDESIAGAVGRSLAADPVSVFGGIVAVNRVLDLAAAENLSKIFLECVIAPGFEANALELLKAKKDLRILEWPELTKLGHELEGRTICGGFLLQTGDRPSDWSSDWKIIGENPPEKIKSDLVLAWKVCALLKSNAIALAGEGMTVGLGMGQVNRVDAVEQAIRRWKKHHEETSSVVMASDAFFPFADSIELAWKAGVRWIIQPGGSIRDAEVIGKAQELGVNLILTGQRHFRH